MKISKSRIDYFLDKKDKDYNPNLDSSNLIAKGYNQAIKDVKKEIERISDFEEMTTKKTNYEKPNNLRRLRKNARPMAMR